MATLKQCDRCNKLLKPPGLAGPDLPSGNSVTYISLQVEGRPWDGGPTSMVVNKVGDYCEECTSIALTFFEQFSQNTEGA